MRIVFKKYIWAAKTIFRRLYFGHIGKFSYIDKPIGIIGAKNIYLGNRVRIQPGCRIETHNAGKIYIEDNVSIGQNFHCTAGGNLVIGSNCTVLGNTFITDIDHDYRQIGVHILDQPQIVKETKIGENCFIGYGAAIQAGTILGKQCVVGANAVVRGKYPDFCVIVGAPGRIVKKYNMQTGEWERVDHE